MVTRTVSGAPLNFGPLAHPLTKQDCAIVSPSQSPSGCGTGGVGRAQLAGLGSPCHGVHTSPKKLGLDLGSIGELSCGIFVALNSCNRVYNLCTMSGYSLARL